MSRTANPRGFSGKGGGVEGMTKGRTAGIGTGAEEVWGGRNIERPLGAMFVSAVITVGE
jgi:hypothetical protein